MKRDIPAKVELTAYTGVAAFNIGFGARTACSAFQVFPKAAWKSELDGAQLRKLEDSGEYFGFHSEAAPGREHIGPGQRAIDFLTKALPSNI